MLSSAVILLNWVVGMVISTSCLPWMRRGPALNMCCEAALYRITESLRDAFSAGPLLSQGRQLVDITAP